MADHYIVEAARSHELAAAFDLLSQRAPLQDRQRAVDIALGLIQRGELRRENVLVVRHGESTCGVTVYSKNGGAAGQVWPPQVRAGYPRDAIENALLRADIRLLREAGAKFVQALLMDNDPNAAACLGRAGFVQLSSLLTLSHPLTPLEHTPAARTLHYRTYLQADEAQFRQTMLRTYEGSLDFPELNGLRDIGEILDAHRQHGLFHPEAWSLVLDGAQPVGVLLLLEIPEQADWELSYVGVVPEARQRGIGREMVRAALRRAADLRAHRLILTVDARNVPAWSLYASEGFLPLEEHQVYLLVPRE